MLSESDEDYEEILPQISENFDGEKQRQTALQLLIDISTIYGGKIPAFLNFKTIV